MENFTPKTTLNELQASIEAQKSAAKKALEDELSDIMAEITDGLKKMLSEAKADSIFFYPTSCSVEVRYTADSIAPSNIPVDIMGTIEGFDMRSKETMLYNRSLCLINRSLSRDVNKKLTEIGFKFTDCTALCGNTYYLDI